MKDSRDSVFRSLRTYNYRLWAVGALVSNIGTWMQRTAQDWLVLTQLTHRNASAMGIVMALQFGPLLVLLPLSGYAADRFDRRKLLAATQTVLALLALGLGTLTVTGLVRLWEVYLFALMLGCVTAFDTPARQTFVSELVGDQDLPNAVGLNSTSFNAARMIGPAIAGLLIAAAGCGWLFILNALSFIAMLAALKALRPAELHRTRRSANKAKGLTDGVRYAWGHADIRTVMVMLFLVGTFGINFPIFISTMAVIVFHADARQYGVLTSMMAVGSVTGAFLSARRTRRSIRLLLLASFAFGTGFTLAAFMPTYWLFGLALLGIGMAAQTFTTSANSLVQLSTAPEMRGRVMALFFAIAMGGTPVGAPIVGWVADRFGPRWALGIGAFAGFSAALVAVQAMMRGRKDEGLLPSPP